MDASPAGRGNGTQSVRRDELNPQSAGPERGRMRVNGRAAFAFLRRAKGLEKEWPGGNLPPGLLNSSSLTTGSIPVRLAGEPDAVTPSRLCPRPSCPQELTASPAC